MSQSPKIEKKPRSKKKSTKVQKPVIAAIGIGLVSMIFMLSRHASETKKVSLAGRAERRPVEVKRSNISIEEPSRTSNAEVIQSRKNAAIESEFGIDHRAAELIGGNVSLRLKIAIQKLWCKAGDLDTIRQTLLEPSSDPLLISIEDLSNKSFIKSFPVKVKDLSGEPTYTVMWPQHDSALLGIYICSDFLKSGKCGSKASLTHQKLSDLSLGPKKGKKDYIFYYQTVFYHNGELKIFDRNSVDDRRRDDIEHYFTAVENIDSDTMKQSESLSTVLHSTRLKFEDGLIVVTLPANDLRCLDSKKLE